MPDPNDPERQSRVAEIRGLRGTDKDAWVAHAARHAPTEGSWSKKDPALHYDATLPSFLQGNRRR